VKSEKIIIKKMKIEKKKETNNAEQY